MVLIILGSVYVVGFVCSWRWIIRWGIESYKSIGLYPAYWDMGVVGPLTLLAILWPFGLPAAYIAIKPHRRGRFKRIERFVGIKVDDV